MHRFTIILLFFFQSVFLLGQELNLDNYKYIIVADKFHFAKTIDEYQTSSLTKFLFEQKGFQVFLSDENFPEDLNSLNNCNVLKADVKEDSNLFTTKIVVQLNDCKGKNVFTSVAGKSKLKDYKKAYHEAIRNAFNTMTDLKYNYKPSEKNLVTVGYNKEISDNIIVIKDSISDEKIQEKEILNSEILYAQTILNGFQLVNATPEVVFILLKTNIKDLFLVKNSQGIVYKEGNDWFFEYYDDAKLIKKQLQIKF